MCPTGDRSGPGASLCPLTCRGGRRKLARYLGADEALWDERFVHYLHDDPGERGTMWLRLVPASITATDLVGPLEDVTPGPLDNVTATQAPFDMIGPRNRP